ncbi:ATP-binding protein [Streptomyces sp. NPDC093085]|uniref:ATP-binding protein n=1 Tax=Streptomyces sp. NPDC093085 TaxID=3155068 RepID=UPI00343D41A3
MEQRGYVLALERYPCTAIAVPEARAIAARAYAPYPWVDHDTVKLLVTETATNAVLHAGGGGFDLICHSPVGSSIQIELHDRSKDEPTRRAVTPWDSHGRGLELLDALAPGWSVVTTLNGKSLIFTLESTACPSTPKAPVPKAPLPKVPSPKAPPPTWYRPTGP